MESAPSQAQIRRITPGRRRSIRATSSRRSNRTTLHSSLNAPFLLETSRSALRDRRLGAALPRTTQSLAAPSTLGDWSPPRCDLLRGRIHKVTVGHDFNGAANGSSTGRLIGPYALGRNTDQGPSRTIVPASVPANTDPIVRYSSSSWPKHSTY